MAKRSAIKGSRKERVPGGQRTPSVSGSDWIVRPARGRVPYGSRQGDGQSTLHLYEASRRHPCQQAGRPVVRRSEPSSSAQVRDRSTWFALRVFCP